MNLCSFTGFPLIQADATLSALPKIAQREGDVNPLPGGRKTVYFTINLADTHGPRKMVGGHFSLILRLT